MKVVYCRGRYKEAVSTRAAWTSHSGLAYSDCLLLLYYILREMRSGVLCKC